MCLCSRCSWRWAPLAADPTQELYFSRPRDNSCCYCFFTLGPLGQYLWEASIVVLVKCAMSMPSCHLSFRNVISSVHTVMPSVRNVMSSVRAVMPSLRTAMPSVRAVMPSARTVMSCRQFVPFWHPFLRSCPTPVPSCHPSYRHAVRSCHRTIRSSWRMDLYAVIPSVRTVMPFVPSYHPFVPAWHPSCRHAIRSYRNVLSAAMTSSRTIMPSLRTVISSIRTIIPSVRIACSSPGFLHRSVSVQLWLLRQLFRSSWISRSVGLVGLRRVLPSCSHARAPFCGLLFGCGSIRCVDTLHHMHPAWRSVGHRSCPLSWTLLEPTDRGLVL
jgi:hypothetical protein